MKSYSVFDMTRLSSSSKTPGENSTSYILIFESSHTHQVYPFYSDETRISIAGNIYEID